MTGNEFAQYLLNASVEAENYINNDAPEIMGRAAKDHFTESFQKEGFTDASFEKWDEVKRRLNPKTKGAAKTRPILTGETGDLGFSIDYINTNAQSTVYSDKPYSEAQNKGTTTAGRNNNVTIPARQFIGDSEQLNNIIMEELGNDLNEIIKKPN